MTARFRSRSRSRTRCRSAREGMLPALALVLLVAAPGCRYAPSADPTARHDAGPAAEAESEASAAGRAPRAHEPWIAADPAAAVVTLENLYENERFWPYQVQLTEDWKPPGWQGDFGWGLGVVKRIDEERRLRVDFGRFGKHWVPAEVTDVVERANRIRLGEEIKFNPNLVLALGNRLLDPSGDELRPTDLDLREQQAFLMVFADPMEVDLGPLARSIDALSALPGLVPVLVVPRDHGDAAVYRACYDHDWPGVFLRDRFGPAYTAGYVAGERPLPFVQLATPEGRLLWQGPWSPELAERLPSLL